MFLKLVIVLMVLCGIGILMGAVIQTRILLRRGVKNSIGRSPVDLYWRGLDRVERYVFWIGLALAVLPLLVIIVLVPLQALFKLF